MTYYFLIAGVDRDRPAVVVGPFASRDDAAAVASWHAQVNGIAKVSDVWEHE